MVAFQPGSNELKLMRKGTRACRECRRRKVKCIYSDDGYATKCHECLEHARICVKQGAVRNTEKDSSSRKVKLKVARLESAVQRLAREESSISKKSIEAFVNEISIHEDERDLTKSDRHPQNQNSISQLFGSHAFFRNGITFSNVSISTKSADAAPSDKEKLLDTLKGFENIDAILQDAGDWWISWRDQHFALKKAASEQTLHGFVRQKLSAESPVLLAIGLLTVAMALERLELGKSPVNWTFHLTPHQLMERITAVVDQVVLDNPAYKNVPSIVLLYMLRARQHAEMNQLRRSWLRIKEAISISKALGLGSEYPLGDVKIEGDILDQQRFVGAIMEVFAFMSMFLGFPHATDPNFTDVRALNVLLSSSSDPSLKARAFRRVIAIAATRVNEKNANKDMSDATTESIQSTLDLAAMSMPPGWWDFTLYSSSETVFQRHENLIIQMWYWNVQTFLHLPHLIDSPGTPSTLKFRQYCLDSCRNAVRLFNYLRMEPSLSVYVCNCDDFQGLISACILMVGLLQSLAEEVPGTNVNCAFDQDMQLVSEMKEIFRYRVSLHGGTVYEQGLKVLDELTWYACGDTDEEKGWSPEAQTVLLPYFGSINLQFVRNSSKLGRQMSTFEATTISRQPDNGEDHVVVGTSINDSSGSSLSSEVSPSDWCSNYASILPNRGFESLPPIDWEVWDRFIVDSELGQDWNPDLTFDMDDLVGQ